MTTAEWVVFAAHLWPFGLAYAVAHLWVHVVRPQR